MNIYTIALDEDPAAAGLKIADEGIVTNIRSLKCMVEALQGRHPDVVIPVPVGRCLISGAKLNDLYNLPGVHEEQAQYCTDKWKFHQTLHEDGLREVACVLLHSKEDVTYCLNMKPPLILKPRFGSGSRGVTWLKDQSTMDQVIKALDFKEDYILETAVKGTEYGLDAAVINDAFFPILLRKKINTPQPYRQCVGYYSVMPGEKFWSVAVETAQKAVDLIGLKDVLIHMDLIEMENGAPFIIEMSARPSGHHLHDVFTPAVTGVDMVQQYIAYVLHRPYDFTVKKTERALIRFFDFSDCEVLKTPSYTALQQRYTLIKYDCHIRPGDRLGKVQDGSIIQRGYFILSGGTERELAQYANQLMKEFLITSYGERR